MLRRDRIMDGLERVDQTEGFLPSRRHPRDFSWVESLLDKPDHASIRPEGLARIAWSQEVSPLAIVHV
jgi:hypothetical protein